MAKLRIQLGRTTDNEPVFFAKIEYRQVRARQALHRAGFYYAGESSDVAAPGCVPLHAWWTKKPEVAVHFLEFSDDDAKAILTTVATRMASSRATDCDEFNDALVPRGKKPFGFQKAGVTFALKRYAAGKKGVLIADEMGLGKSIQSILIANTLPANAKILVLCPASVISNWGTEWARWDIHKRRVSLITDTYQKPGTDVLVMNYDRFATARGEDVTTALMTQRWSLIILDESHRLKNPASKRTRHIFGHYDRGVRVSPGLVHVGERLLALTGTPIENRVKEFLPLLRALDADVARDEASYLFRFCGAVQRKDGAWDFEGSTRCEQLQDALRSDVMVRRLKHQVFSDMPPKIRTVASLDCGTTAETYRKRERSVIQDIEKLQADVADLKENGDHFAKAVGSLTSKHCPFNEVAALRAALAVVKAPAVCQYVSDLMRSGNSKIIVFGHHKILLDVLEGCFGGRSTVRIDGSVDAKKRQGIVDAFQTDPRIRLALLSTRAAGVGLNLTAAPTVVFAEADWNPAWLQQAEDRVHRIGQLAEVVNIHYCIVDGTLDAHVIQVAINKMDIAERVLDTEYDLDAKALTAESQWLDEEEAALT